LRRGVQVLQGGGDHPVGGHVAGEPGCFSMGEPGAGQEQGSRAALMNCSPCHWDYSFDRA
jgi:hypothetical protein